MKIFRCLALSYPQEVRFSLRSVLMTQPKIFILVLLTAWLLIASVSAVGCTAPIHLETITSSSTWTTDLPFSESKEVNLTRDTTLCDGPISGGADNTIAPYTESSGIVGKSYVQQTNQEHLTVPADRIIKSSIKIINRSDNFEAVIRAL